MWGRVKFGHLWTTTLLLLLQIKTSYVPPYGVGFNVVKTEVIIINVLALTSVLGKINDGIRYGLSTSQLSKTLGLPNILHGSLSYKSLGVRVFGVTEIYLRKSTYENRSLVRINFYLHLPWGGEVRQVSKETK